MGAKKGQEREREEKEGAGAGAGAPGGRVVSVGNRPARPVSVRIASRHDVGGPMSAIEE